MEFQQKEAQPSQVKYVRHPDGRVEFDATGLNEWEINHAIDSVEEGNRKQYEAAQAIKKIAVTGDLAMHCLALGFVLLLSSMIGFVGIRVILGSSQGSIQNVQQR